MIFKKNNNLASQAKIHTKYLNMKTKLLKMANTYFNKECLIHKLTRTYAKIKDKNKAAIKQNNKTTIINTKNLKTLREEVRIKIMAFHLNPSLYRIVGNLKTLDNIPRVMKMGKLKYENRSEKIVSFQRVILGIHFV